MAKNKNLTTAKKQKNDEFYTRTQDIENELKYYKDQFYDKVVYCNCDNPAKSEFCTFFRLKFCDHIVAWKDGGKTDYDNLQMLCKHCNRTKSGK